jgi:hypothetical protein
LPGDQKNSVLAGGWLAVRQTLDFDGKRLDEEGFAKLVAIEAELLPTDLANKVGAIVSVDLDDLEDHGREDMGARRARTETLDRDLGKAVARDQAILNELLRKVMVSDGRLWLFGQGLVEGAGKPQVLMGFLYQLPVRKPGRGSC